MVLEGKLLSSGLGKGTKYTLAEKRNAPSGILKNDPGSDTFQGTLFSELEESERGEGTGGISENAPSGILRKHTGKKRNKKTLLLHKMILEYCTDYKSLSEISEHVKRSVTHIKKHVIPELLESGKLQRKYPDVLSHPDQKYKAV